MPLSQRDRRALYGGGAVIAVLLLYLLWPSGDSRPSPDPVPTDIAAAVPVSEQPATYATPVQPVVVAAPGQPAGVAPPAAAAPATGASQLRLYGILSRGAVIGMADGTQRFVPVGREFAPGMTLRGVDLHHAIVSTPSGEIRLGFEPPAQPPVSQPAP